jgi:hypothetical protein
MYCDRGQPRYEYDTTKYCEQGIDEVLHGRSAQQQGRSVNLSASSRRSQQQKKEDSCCTLPAIEQAEVHINVGCAAVAQGTAAAAAISSSNRGPNGKIASENHFQAILLRRPHTSAEGFKSNHITSIMKFCVASLVALAGKSWLCSQASFHVRISCPQLKSTSMQAACAV